MPPWGPVSSTGLVAWWSLGEGGGSWPTGVYQTPNFCLDASGNGNNLAAMNAAPWGGVGPRPVWITDPSSAALPDTSVTPPSIRDFDGGAIRFNLNQFQWISFPYFLCLQSGIVVPEYSLYFEGVGSGTSVAFWVAFVPFADAVNEFAPFTDVGFWPYLFGDWGHEFGIKSGGTRAGFDPNSGEFVYFTQDSEVPGYPGTYGGAIWSYVTAPLAPYAWHHVACTLEKTVGGPGGPHDPTARFRRRFYFDGVMVADLEGVPADVAVAQPENSFSLGGSWSDDIRFAHCAGQLDEFSVWHRTLSPAEITSLSTVTALGVHLPPRELV